MKKLPSAFCFLLSAFSFLLSAAQPLVTSEYNHRHYGIPEGLPTEMVECAFQDSRGFMWFGTEHGAARFDGHEFKTYLANKSLPINKIEENEQGEIIIYGYYFIYALNPKTEELRMTFQNDNLNYCVDKSPGLPKGYSIYTKRDVKQIALFKLESDTLTECFAHPAFAEMDYGQSIYYDTDAQLIYIPTRNKQVRIVEFTGTERAPINNLPACRFLKHNGELLAVGYEGVWAITPHGATLRLKFPKAIDMPAINSDGDFMAIMDPDGNIIIRDDRNVQRYRNQCFEMIIDNINIPRSMMFDHEGNFWFTSRQGVYNFFKLDGITYKVNAHNADKVNAIVPVASQELYLATENGKLIHYQNNKFTNIAYPALPDGSANIFSYRSIKVGDAIYFTSFQDILKYKNGQFRWLNIPPEIYHVASCRINDHEFAIGGWDKIFIMDNEGNLLRSVSQTNIKRAAIYTMQADSQNRLWLGTHKGICCVNGEDRHYFFSENTMNGEDSDKDPTGRIWIACESHIYYTDGDTIRLFMEFPNTIILNLRYTHNNLIVISYNSGIKIIDPVTKHVVNYNYTNGYSSGEPAWTTMVEDFDGNIWMGTQGPNVLKFNPSQLMHREYKVTLHLTQSQFSDNNIEMHDMETGAQLKHNQRNVRFSFVGLCFANPDIVSYRYRLKGFQDDWSEPTKQREVTFTNLPPGDYVFEIYAITENEDTHLEIRSMVFSIKSALWQSTWFFILSIALLMLVGAGIALYFQRRRNKALLEKLRIEKELNELRISSIRLKAIPHFNANVLAAIEYYIANRTKEDVMPIIGIYSDFTIKTLSEVDKASRPISEELAYVKMYLDLEKIRFMDKFDFQIQVDPEVDETVQLPNMILHTYCENAVKHGLMPLKSGGLLTINVSQHHNKVCVSVEDNGVGRTYALQNPQPQSTKQGLSILNRQIEIYNRFNKETINQRIDDLYENGKPSGTVFTVEVPVEFRYVN
jgi:streptogramin lyase